MVLKVIRGYDWVVVGGVQNIYEKTQRRLKSRRKNDIIVDFPPFRLIDSDDLVRLARDPYHTCRRTSLYTGRTGERREPTRVRIRTIILFFYPFNNTKINSLTATVCYDIIIIIAI